MVCRLFAFPLYFIKSSTPPSSYTLSLKQRMDVCVCVTLQNHPAHLPFTPTLPSILSPRQLDVCVCVCLCLCMRDCNLLYKLPPHSTLHPHPTPSLDNWMREFETWAPDLIVVKYNGSQQHREHIRDQIYSEEGLEFNVMISRLVM